MPDRGKGCREISREIEQEPSTVAIEVGRHRFVGSWPRCCNGCAKRQGYGCSRRPKIFGDARMAQRAADAELLEARRGVDETEPSAGAELDLTPVRVERARAERGEAPLAE